MADVTRRQAFALVDLADALAADLIPDYDVAAVDRVHLLLDDGIRALRLDHKRAAHLAAQVIAIMTGPDAPKQEKP